MSPITGLDEIEMEEVSDEEVSEGQEDDRQEGEEGQAEAQGQGGNEEESEAVQLPLEKWSENQLAEAGIDLANHMHKLKAYEEGESKHRRHFKENRDRMVDVIDGLRLRIREQRYALGTADGEGVALLDEEE